LETLILFLFKKPAMRVAEPDILSFVGGAIDLAVERRYDSS